MKAILVIDMPENCIECPLHQRYCGAICRALEKEHTDERFYHREDWCPLRPMPIKKEALMGMGKINFGKALGWNDCLDEILGETDENVDLKMTDKVFHSVEELFEDLNDGETE